MDSETQPTVEEVLTAARILEQNRDMAIKVLLEQRRVIDNQLAALGKGRVGRPPKPQGASKRSRGVRGGGQGVSGPVAQACSTMAGTVA